MRIPVGTIPGIVDGFRGLMVGRERFRLADESGSLFSSLTEGLTTRDDVGNAVVESDLWSLSAPISCTTGAMAFRRMAISDVRMYSVLHWWMSGSVSTSSSRSPMASWYAVVTGMARSMIASRMACARRLASSLCRSTVPGVCRRRMIGACTSCAEYSKKEITVLSAHKKMETCSMDTPMPLEPRTACRSIWIEL